MTEMSDYEFYKKNPKAIVERIRHYGIVGIMGLKMTPGQKDEILFLSLHHMSEENSRLFGFFGTIGILSDCSVVKCEFSILDRTGVQMSTVLLEKIVTHMDGREIRSVGPYIPRGGSEEFIGMMNKLYGFDKNETDMEIRRNHFDWE